MSGKRAFIAYKPNSVQLKESLEQVQTKLKQKPFKTKLVDPDNYHLTTAFLGALNPMDLAKAKALVATFSSNDDKFKLQLNKLSAFPDVEQAKVIIAKISGRDIKKLHKLVRALRRNLKKRQIWYDQKPFVAHITIARTKRATKLNYFIENHQLKPTEFWLNRLHLYTAQSTNKGPIYQQIV